MHNINWTEWLPFHGAGHGSIWNAFKHLWNKKFKYHSLHRWKRSFDPFTLLFKNDTTMIWVMIFHNTILFILFAVSMFEKLNLICFISLKQSFSNQKKIKKSFCSHSPNRIYLYQSENKLSIIITLLFILVDSHSNNKIILRFHRNIKKQCCNNEKEKKWFKQLINVCHCWINPIVSLVQV